MGELLYSILKWSEVWAIFIPLTIIVFYKNGQKEMQPVIIFVWITMVLNVGSRLLTELRNAEMLGGMPEFLQSNLLLYNLSSITRVILLGWFIANAALLKPVKAFRYCLPVYAVLVLFNFIFRQSPSSLSADLYATECIILLTLCVAYFLYSIKDESDIIWMEQPSFIICTGISLYEVINFFIFLFFDAIRKTNENFGRVTMQIFSISYIIFCILLAIALFRNRKKMKKMISVPQ